MSDVQELLRRARQRLVRAADSAPEDLSDEFDAVIDAVDDLDDLLVDEEDGDD